MFVFKKVVGRTAIGSSLWLNRPLSSGLQSCNGKITNLGRFRAMAIEDGRISGVRHYQTRSTGCGDPCAHLKWMDVNCKTALITGGTTGIGLAIADALLAAGLQKAYISGRNDKVGAKAVHELSKKHGEGRSGFIPLDVNNYKQFEDAFKDILCKEGSVDILVNNAGILNDRNWELEMDTNIKGVMRGILLANKYMPKQKNRGGCVVNIASIYGFDAFPYAPGYNSTKHAVVGLTKAFGDPANYRKNGVRHIALGPGITRTKMIQLSPDRLLEEEWEKKASDGISSMPLQSTEVVGRGALYSILYGPPGSLWVVEGSKLQMLRPPTREKYQTKVIDL